MSVPANPKIYHIVHVDRLASIVQNGRLFCDAIVQEQSMSGTTIGMSGIKARRLMLPLNSHPALRVGGCVPFYFCPRSIMLYLIHMANHPELSYRGGQDAIVHLEFDLRAVVRWAEARELRWAFTLSNAASHYFEDSCDLERLGDLDWTAIKARYWSKHKEGKQAEFLVENSCSWELVNSIGVNTPQTRAQVADVLSGCDHVPPLQIMKQWYY